MLKMTMYAFICLALRIYKSGMAIKLNDSPIS